MLKDLFGHPIEKGFKLAEEVDRTGRAIVLTTTLEHAELKRDQIHAYGPDPTHRAVPGVDVRGDRAGGIARVREQSRRLSAKSRTTASSRTCALGTSP